MKRSPLIAPSIIAADFLHLGKEIEWLNESDSDLLHLDIMDGHFVPNISLGFPAVEALSSVVRLPLDVHLMIRSPEAYLSRCKEMGAARICVHAEACPELKSTLEQIRALGCKAGVALNPDTSTECLEQLWPLLDIVLLMSVTPGFAGQAFLPGSIEKVKKVHKLRANTHSQSEIVVDGGVNLSLSQELWQAGADVLVVGKALFSAKDRNSYLNALKKSCN